MRTNAFIRTLQQQKYLYLMILPCVVWLFLFCYIPMGGVVLAFKNYRAIDGLWGSEWVGLKWFGQFLSSPLSLKILRNTIAISVIKLALGFPIPILFALLVNEIQSRRYLKVVQTISYLPHFLSWVITVSLFTRLLSVDGGIVNVVLEKLFHVEAVNFFGEPGYAWPISYITEVWKETGWSAIIYIAALSSINPELYEAATLDGASKLQRLRHISLPGIRGTVIILLILAAGGILNTNFDQMYIIRNSANIETSEVIDTYIFERTMNDAFSYSYIIAVGFFKSAINIAILLGMNYGVRLIGEDGLF